MRFSTMNIKKYAKVDFEKRCENYAKNYQYVICLDNGKWCYGEQVLAIVED